MKRKTTILVALLLGFVTVVLIHSCQKDWITLYPNDFPVYTNGEGVVGPTGGIVMLDDETSPLFGTFIEIPEGALTSDTLITISLAPSDMDNLADSLAILVKFEPQGLVFEVPVIIGIPFHINNADTTGLHIFHFEPDSLVYTKMPKRRIDPDNNIIIGETMHFSYYTALDQRAKINIEMLTIDNRIGARLRLKDLDKIRTRTSVCLNDGYCNVWDVIRHNTYYDKSVFRVSLYRHRSLWLDERIETKNIYIWRRTHGHSADAVVLIGYDGPGHDDEAYRTSYISQNGPDSELAMWNSGAPLVFYFDDFEPNSGHNYFVKVKWFYSAMPVQNIFARATPLYEFDNKEVSMPVSQMTPFPLDQLHESMVIDNSYIDGDGPLPTVSTSNVSNITQTSATGGGNVTHGGSTPVDAHGLVWSTSENPTIGNAEGSNVIGTGTGAFTGDILNLTPNTTYYVRAYATNSAGTGYGDDVAFKTLGDDDDVPQSPSNVYAGDWSTEQGFGVYWNDNSANETGFRIYKSTNSLTDLQLYGTVPANSTFFEDSNDNPDLFHAYRVTAFNDDGESVMSNLAVVPKRPVNLAGQSGSNEITISWNYPTNSQAERVYLQRSTSTSGPFSPHGWVSHPATSITDNSAESGVDYYYRVHSVWVGEATSASRSIPTNVIGPFNVENDNGGPDIIYGDGVTDIDGNEYVTVIIENQEWMAENLRVTRYNNGDDIPTGLSDDDWANTSNGAYAVYPHDGGVTEDDVEGINSDEEMVAAYGKLYNWYAVDDVRGLCPDGWHVASDAEWTELVSYVVSQGFPSSSASNALKSCRQVNSPIGGECDTSEHPRWDSHTTHHGFDEFGFSALPGGGRWSNGSFNGIQRGGYWWSSSGGFNFAWGWHMGFSFGGVTRYQNSLPIGYSVRCVRDN